ncbi:hypothetical protein [uncultured Zobellia sp.]|uniref:hypothetical protein n=1 Tax=uncultured Zobellia sp. TaxID=255433 RepID=UPI002595A4D1|nr:hypothetical protein [uncultured Zobellia sp.]
MIKKDRNKEEQNEFAENVKGDIIYILDAPSGKKGYFCIGCKTEMQAVKSKIRGRKSYFRHDATDVQKNERECTFSNQNYRHSQAMSILNRIKRIKVPTLYKYPPKNSDGKTIKLKDSEFIEAKYTKSELIFYETDDGDVKFGKNREIDNKNLLIRPDVTFFNAQNEPILLIEIVVTHKIDSEKLAKIKRLGIDTVQITIPKDSLENIEKSFSLGRQIKWIHNNEQERAEYIYSPNNDTKGVSQIDELQRKLFEESFECRKSQIKNLIRAITKCLESQQYKGIERGLRQEIQRVENNSERAEEKLEKHRNGIRERVEGKFKQRRKFIETKREKLDREETDIEKLYQDEERKLNTFFGENETAIKERGRDLEERYIKRRKEIEGEQRDIGKSILEIEFFESTEREYRKEEQEVADSINRVGERKTDNLRIREQLPKRFERLHKQETDKFRREKEKIKEEKNGLPKFFEHKEKDLESEFEELRNETIEQIKNSNIKGTSEFSGRLKRILDARRVFNDWNERANTLKRNRAAMECLRKGAYKNWN